MPQIYFGDEELPVLREALLTCYYLASDEERSLAARLRGTELDATERSVTEHGRAAAALRAMRYAVLADRVAPSDRIGFGNPPTRRDTPDTPHAP